MSFVKRLRMSIIGASKDLNLQTILAGGHSREATPDPLPNSAVKISSADGTAVKTVGEQVAAGLLFLSVYPIGYTLFFVLV